MTTWYILDRDGNALNPEEVEARPEDARPMEEGSPLTPWYKTEAHLHIEDGKITGIHAKGTLDEVKILLEHFKANEKELFERISDPNNDVILEEALKLVPIKESKIDFR